MKRKSSMLFFLFLLPALALVMVFRYYPLFSAVYHSFTRWNVIESHFVGFQNYSKLFNDDYFWVSLRNAFIYVAIRVLVITFMSILGAELVFNIYNKRVSYFWRYIFIVPMVIPVSVTLLLWKFIFSPFGILNQLLYSFNLSHITRAWLGDPKTALYAIAFIGFPFLSTAQFLIILSALQNIDSSLIDSSKVDGATTLKRILKIDLPIISDKILLVVILTFMWDFQSVQNFLILTQGGPGTSTLVPGLYVYQAAFNFNELGYSCTIGVIMTVLLLMIVIPLNSVLNRINR